MSLVLDILSIMAICAGAFFFFAGTVGLLRFPDALSRLHALTKADNLGLGLVVLGFTATHRKPTRLTQARRRLGAHSIGRRDGCAAHCARRPA